MNESANPSSDVAAPAAVSLREAFWYWLRLGFISFGVRRGRFRSCTRTWWSGVVGSRSAASCMR